MSKLDKIRAAIQKRIDDNPYTIVSWIRPTMDNGYGAQVPDLTQPAVETILGIVTVSRRRLPDVVITNPKTPYDYNDVYYLIAPYDAIWLKQDIIFDYYAERFRTCKPEQRIMFGGIAYILCDLEQTTTLKVGE